MHPAAEKQGCFYQQIPALVVGKLVAKHQRQLIGGEGFVRACYAASMKDIAESVARMDNFLKNLRREQGKEN